MISHTLIMVEEAMETVLLEREEMSKNKLTILCDKVKGSLSQDGAAFVKLATQCNDKRQQVCATWVGIQSAGNTSEDRALGIDEVTSDFFYHMGKTWFFFKKHMVIRKFLPYFMKNIVTQILKLAKIPLFNFLSTLTWKLSNFIEYFKVYS